MFDCVRWFESDCGNGIRMTCPSLYPDTLVQARTVPNCVDTSALFGVHAYHLVVISRMFSFSTHRSAFLLSILATGAVNGATASNATALMDWRAGDPVPPSLVRIVRH